MKIPSRHPDQDGMDEWQLSIFDDTNPSEAMAEVQGTLAEMMWRASAWVKRNPETQTRIVLEQIR